MSERTEKASERAINAPNVVLILIAGFVAIHFYRSYLPAEEDLQLLLRFAFIPARFDAPADVPAEWIVGGRAAQAWSFVTHAFLHGDWLHLGVNSFWMLAFGSVVARRFGAARFLLFSTLCAVAGAGIYLLLHSQEFVFLIGASCAISGQMAGAVRFIFARPANLLLAGRMQPEHMRAQSLVEVFRNPRALVFLATWAGINVLFGLTGEELAGVDNVIAWEAHLAGFAAGLLLFGIFDRRRNQPD
jgi:membrane associated rhomboid family serine protease